jgi:hypothetical protein
MSSKKKSQTVEYTEEEIEDLLENIELKRPRSSYTHFCMQEAEKYKKTSKDGKIDLKTFSSECANKWSKLSEKEKKVYKKKFEEDKAKYKKDLEVIRHVLFKDYNEVVKRPPTAYRIFLNEKLREGFEKNLDPKEVKKQASEDWRKMDQDERKVYIDRKKENDDWYEKAKNTRKVTALSIFVQNEIQTAKDKHKEIPKLADIAPSWKKLSKSEKEKYKKYADAINEERERLQDLYELVNGVKPKRPAGAFRVFLQEKAKEKVLHDINEGKELWNKLSEEEKEKYLKKAHKCRLAYKYKKMIYNKKIKKILPKKPATSFGYFLKEKKGIKIPKGENPLIYWREEFNKLTKDKMKKYEEKAAKEKEKYEKKMGEFNNYVFDMPKRPLNAFSLFVKDHLPDLKKENDELPTNKLIKIAAKQWKEEDGVSQSTYEKKAEQDKKRFLKQMKDFEKFGYYKKNTRGENTKKDEEEEEEKKSKKSKKKRSESNSSKSTRKTSKKTQSKTKNLKKKSTSKSSKKIAKTQKKK